MHIVLRFIIKIQFVFVASSKHVLQVSFKMSLVQAFAERQNLNLLNQMECVCCLDYMRSKIFICKIGHSVCGSCYKFLKNCGVCKQPMTSRRNFNLEAISEILKYPCTFSGCTVFISPKRSEEHKQKCSFRSFQCLLSSEDSQCTWVGAKVDLLNHAIEKHPEKAWMKTENLDRWTKNVDKNEEVQLGEAFNQVFYVLRKCVTTNTDPTRSVMYWAVQLVGSSEEASHFKYEVILSDDEKQVEFSLKNLCQDDTLNFSNLIDAGKCVGVPLNILETFFNDENTVSYMIKIESVFEDY